MPSTGTSKTPQGVSPLKVPKDRLSGTQVVTRKTASPAMWSKDSHRYDDFDAYSPILADMLDDDPRLIQSHDSRPTRLHATVPESTALLTNLKPHSAILSASTQKPNNNFGQDVCELVNATSLPSPSPATHIPVSPSLLLEPSVSSLFNHHDLIQLNSCPRTSNQVFQTGEELALHYGIPTLLPPPPTIKKTKQASILDFDTLRNNYLNMISQKPSEPSMSVDVPVPVPDESVPSTEMDETDQFINELLTCKPVHVTAITRSDSEVDTAPMQWDYLTSPVALGTPAQDFELSPDETPLTEFLNTPLIEAGDELFPSPAFSSDLDLFPTDGHSYYTAVPESVKTKSAELPPELPDSLLEMPPLPEPDTIDPTAIYPSPTHTVAPASFSSVQSALDTLSPTEPTTSTFVSGTGTIIARRTRSNATGTRKNLSPDKLIPLDAPTQPRRYVMPSATSRKEVPAVFQRKRQRSEMEEEQDELEPLPPNATEREQIEYKRRQNTLAARKSRKRKLMYQRDLETHNSDLMEEVTRWKTRCDVLSKMLESHGIMPPSFTD